MLPIYYRDGSIGQVTWSHSIAAAGNRSIGLANKAISNRVWPTVTAFWHCCWSYVHAGDPQVETLRLFHIHHLDLPKGKIDVRYSMESKHLNTWNRYFRKKKHQNCFSLYYIMNHTTKNEFFSIVSDKFCIFQISTS